MPNIAPIELPPWFFGSVVTYKLEIIEKIINAKLIYNSVYY